MGQTDVIDAMVSMPEPSEPLSKIWKPSALQREYRAVLDDAKREPQVILDVDNIQLIVELKVTSDFLRELRSRLVQLARFSAVWRANRDRSPSEWASQTDFPYLASFDRDEVKEFGQELLSYTLDAAQRGTMENLEGNLRAWSSSAGIYENPEVLEQMLGDIDY